MSIYEFINRNWGAIAAGGATICTVTVFIRDAFTIRKLRREIRALKEADEAKKQRIVIATMTEIHRYASRYPQQIAHLSPPPLLAGLTERFGLIPLATVLSWLCLSVLWSLSFAFPTLGCLWSITLFATAFILVGSILLLPFDWLYTRRRMLDLMEKIYEHDEVA